MPPPAAASAVATIEGARAALRATPDTTTSFLDPGHALSMLACDYMHALLGGCRGAAVRLVFKAADCGEPIQRLYLKVFQPVLRKVGRLWRMNKISVAQEHFCSACTRIVRSQLLARGPGAKALRLWHRHRLYQRR